MNLCKCGCGLEVKENYKHGHGRKGRKNSVNHNKKIGDANRGRKLSPERIEQIKKYTLCRIQSIDEREMRSKIAKERGFGKWMKGRKLSKETIAKITAANTGHKCSLITRTKISSKNSGMNNGMYGKTHTAEAKDIISKRSKEIWSDPDIRRRLLNYPGRIENCRRGALKAAEVMSSYNFCNTKPEKCMKSYLDILGMDYVQHYSVSNIKHCYSSDFYLPLLNTIIEVDGKYWHNYPYGREIDHIRGKELTDVGYGILRFWEDEFDLDDVKNALGYIK